MKLSSLRLAADTATDASTQKLDTLGKSIYGSDVANKADLIPFIGGLIKAAIGTLGVIFVILTVYAGFLWMTARGDEDKVTKAKETLERSVIGLVIIIAAYAIASFVLSRVTGITTPAAP